MSPFSPEAALVRAGRLMLSEMRFYADKRMSFALETTLSGRSYLNLVKHLIAQGYKTHFFFLWVGVVDVAMSRIRERALKGGHDVPEAVVRRRFERSIKNFLNEYRHLADAWYLFDNSGAAPELISLKRENRLRMIKSDVYQEIVTHYGQNERNF